MNGFLQDICAFCTQISVSVPQTGDISKIRREKPDGKSEILLWGKNERSPERLTRPHRESFREKER